MDLDDCVVGLNKEKMQKVSDFRTLVNITLSDTDDRASLQLDQAVKYLRATKFNVEKAQEVFHNYQRHREVYKLSQLKSLGQVLNAEIRTRKLEVLGTRDSKGAQLLLYTASRHTPKSHDCQTVMQLFFLIFDQISESGENQSKGVSLLLDLRDCNKASFNNLYASNLFSLLLNGYPLYLNTVYIIEAPSWFKSHHSIPSFMSLKQQGKINSCTVSSLPNFLPTASLPMSLGGSFTPGASSFVSSNEAFTRQTSSARNPPLTPPPRKSRALLQHSSMTDLMPLVVSTSDDSQESLDNQPVQGSVEKMKKKFTSSPSHAPIQPKPLPSSKPKPKGPKPIPPPRVSHNGDGPTESNRVRIPILPPLAKEKKVKEIGLRKSRSIDESGDTTSSSTNSQTKNESTKSSSEGPKPSLLSKLRLKTKDDGTTGSNKRKEDLKSPEKPTVPGLGNNKKPHPLIGKGKPSSSTGNSHDLTQNKSKNSESKKSGRHKDLNPPPSYDAPSPPEVTVQSTSQTVNSKPQSSQYENLHVCVPKPLANIMNTNGGFEPTEPVPASEGLSANHRAVPYKVTTLSIDPSSLVSPLHNSSDVSKVKSRDQQKKEGVSLSQESTCKIEKEGTKKVKCYENVFFTKAEEDEGECLSAEIVDEGIYENFGPDEGNRWMSVDELVQYVVNKGKGGLSAEYYKIKNEPLSGSADTFRLACNTSKNRYKDVVCYDSTRVILDLQDGVEGSDYIHANYVDGFEKKRAFIITQGPLKRTVNDYWRMLWEKEVFVVVMTTKCVEMAKLKCAHYWPDEKEALGTFGNISVKVLNCQQKSSFEFRKLLVCCRGESRMLMHYQFTSWPDYGVPDTGKDAVELLYTAREMQESYREYVVNPDRFPIHGPPLVIHCSAGIGRSGTFYALDYCIDELRVKGRVNIQHCVRQLRQQRAFAIQTDEQYMFCYSTVLEYGKYLMDVMKL